MTFVWPFVSRRAYDDKRHEVTALRVDLVVERDRSATLLQHLIDLKRTGFEAGMPVASTAPAEPDLPGEIVEAIRATTAGGSERMRYERLAREWLREQVDVTEIRRRLYDGETLTV